MIKEPADFDPVSCLKSIIIGIFHRQVSQTSSDTAHIKIQIPPHIKPASGDFSPEAVCFI